MSTPEMSYESATARLEEIVRRLDSGEAGLRETLDLCQEGRGLVEFCATELDAVAAGLQELRLEDLVARLERPAAQAAAPAPPAGADPQAAAPAAPQPPADPGPPDETYGRASF